MAQIKVMKINSSGYLEEHGSSDDITFNTLTGTTQVAVNGGVTLTNNITFNALSDTIAGIQNQNLLDKTATESITGDYTIATGHTLTVVDDPVNDTDVANKAYVDSRIYGLSWQEPVLDRDLSAAPGSPSNGDRYIVATGVSTGDDWFGQEKKIAEWDAGATGGGAWVFTTPSEGWALWVEDENVQVVYNDDYPTGNWVKLSSTTNHNNLSGLQGGTTNQYYHMTSAEYTWLQAVISKIPTATNVASLAANETVVGDWIFNGDNDFNGENDFADGDLILPDSAMGAPVEGSIYWDAGNNLLKVYDGSSYVDMNALVDATKLVQQFTAGAGGISQYDAVYISANDTVLPADASSISTSKVVGVAPSAISAAAQGNIVRSGVVVNAISGLGASAGQPIFLSTTAGGLSTSIPTGSGNSVLIVGYAKNTTDLLVDIKTIKIRG
jgi:hypothetical protein